MSSQPVVLRVVDNTESAKDNRQQHKRAKFQHGQQGRPQSRSLLTQAVTRLAFRSFRFGHHNSNHQGRQAARHSEDKQGQPPAGQLPDPQHLEWQYQVGQVRQPTAQRSNNHNRKVERQVVDTNRR